MKILNAKQIREADQFTIKHEPIASEDLMERASNVFVKWFIKKFRHKKHVAIFCGIGNNGGDGLAVARLLFDRNYSVRVFIIRYSENSSKDFQINEARLSELKKVTVNELRLSDKLPVVSNDEIIIDAMWGSGLNRPIEGFPAKLIRHLNKANAIRVSIDIPSGLYADKKSDSVIFKADVTLSFELPKLSFLFPENYSYVGQWKAKSIGLDQDFIAKAKSDNFLLTKKMIRPLLIKRKKFDHKGTFGHAMLITGSHGKIGAAVLASRACLRAGAGLLSVYLPGCGYTILQTAFPEAMVMTDPDRNIITSVPKLTGYNAIGIGPGLGRQTRTAETLFKILKGHRRPIVMDADALNILGENKSWLKLIPKNSILTPHPKEFERVFGPTEDSYQRHALQKRASKKYNIFIVLKGGNTAISCPDGNTYFNSTGNPGMATAGAGDVLTGMLTGLLAQGYDPKSVCLIGVYLHGLAGDIAADSIGQEAMTASDIIENIGKAYKKING